MPLKVILFRTYLLVCTTPQLRLMDYVYRARIHKVWKRSWKQIRDVSTSIENLVPISNHRVSRIFDESQPHLPPCEYVCI
jgi:hypothetical protein